MMLSGPFEGVAYLTESPFKSFFSGGFECASHRRSHRGRLDVIRATHHDARVADDYRMLAELGVCTVRDGLRWHLIEATPGHYDWSSFLPMLQAAASTRTQVIWDLCHWGVPDDVNPFADDFVHRFERFASEAAKVVRDHTDEPPFFCPINEISFWSLMGGQRGHFYPYGKRRGGELKRRLIEASIVATKAIRTVAPNARFVQCEPIIHISPSFRNPETAEAVAAYTLAQFESWDMLSGRLAPELGGDESCLDVIGCNYYWNNQWVHRSHATPIGHLQHRSLHRMLLDVYERYKRPMLISETGAEADSGPGWLGMICSEARLAIRNGVDLHGVCLYPVMDYPGWDNNRHCPCGLIALDEDWSGRSIHSDLAEELGSQKELFACERTLEAQNA
jgi:beta-glucosidase/6-phospho-beta-glucosidase/beta-galactosidase